MIEVEHRRKRDAELIATKGDEHLPKKKKSKSQKE